MEQSKKLYKTSEGSVFGGVCKGFSEVYGMDVNTVRILYVLITFFVVGAPLIIYLILYLVLPNKEEVVIPYVDPKDDYTVDDDKYYY